MEAGTRRGTHTSRCRDLLIEMDGCLKLPGTFLSSPLTRTGRKSCENLPLSPRRMPIGLQIQLTVEVLHVESASTHLVGRSHRLWYTAEVCLLVGRETSP